MRRLILLCGCILLSGLAGCAHYEYDLVQPPQFARHIGAKQDERVDLPPLVYLLRTADNHLVMRIQNPTDEPIQLLGAQSSVVSPDGQSHPLPSQTIAPGAFIKLIFPPIRPPVGHIGPSIGFGVGVSHRVQREDDSIWDDSVAQPQRVPRYLQLDADSSAYYWDFSGEGEMRLLLTYQRGVTSFHHDFVFRRRKM